MENDTAVAVVPAASSRAMTLRDVFQPRSLEQALDLAARVASSTICPARYRDNPGDVFVAAAYGAEIGLSFMQSVQGVVVINGIPTIYGDHALGVVRASGLCLYVREWIDDTQENNLVAHCVTHRKGEPEPVERTFSEDDAERAGLLGKTGPWQTHEKRMLQMRARGFCLRDTYADVLRGLRLTEELEGESLIVDVDGPPTGPARRVTPASIAQQIPMPRALGGTPTPVAPAADAPVDDVPVDVPADEPAPVDDAPDEATEAEVVAPCNDPAPLTYRVDSVTQRTRPEPEGVTYTVVLLPSDGSDPVAVRTREREVATAARTARRADAALDVILVETELGPTIGRLALAR